ncbi:MAG TPA: hypothetical protein VMG10_36935 [Gemmataceae bacterium]|nr:hypothetical protein [Gemmataceae bacterium]
MTRGILEELVAYHPRSLIQTRGPLAVRDLDGITRFRSVRVNMSLPTDSEEMQRALGSKAPPAGVGRSEGSGRGDTGLPACLE